MLIGRWSLKKERYKLDGEGIATSTSLTSCYRNCNAKLNSNRMLDGSCGMEEVENQAPMEHGKIFNFDHEKQLFSRLYIGEEQTVYNGMIFKANQTIFQVT